MTSDTLDLAAIPVGSIIDEEDPFGPDDSTRNLPPVGSKGYGKVSGIKSKGSPFKAREHYPRVRKMLENDLYPGSFFWNCDRKQVRYDGSMYDQDLLGFMDIQGVTRDSRLIGVNVTTIDAIGAHLRDYTSSSNTYGQAKLLVRDLLRRFLDCGAEFLICGAHKEGSRWQYEVKRVTPQLMDEYIARKKDRGVQTSTKKARRK